MKSLVKSTLTGVIFCSLALFLSCGSDDGPGQSIEDVQLGKLSKAWNATTVELDGIVQTGYDNFVLTMTGSAGSASFGYSTAGRPQLSPWPSSGNWVFGGSPETQIIRDQGTQDEIAVTYSVTDTQLQLTFNFTGTGFAGKTSNVGGLWVFTFGL